MTQHLRVPRRTIQLREDFKCHACRRRFAISDLGYCDGGVRLCADCAGSTLQDRLGIIAILDGVSRALKRRRFQLARQFAAWGLAEMARLEGVHVG